MKIQITRKDINEMVSASVKKVLKEYFSTGSMYDGLFSNNPGSPDYEENDDDRYGEETEDTLYEAKSRVLKRFLELEFPNINYDEMVNALESAGWHGDVINIRYWYDYQKETYDWDSDDYHGFEIKRALSHIKPEFVEPFEMFDNFFKNYTDEYIKGIAGSDSGIYDDIDDTLETKADIDIFMK